MIREKDGIHIEESIKVVADSRSAKGDVNVVTHAHSDHALKKDFSNVVCSDKTAEISRKRFDTDFKYSERHENVDLLPSGHIIGSRAALINKKVLYTGDVSTRDRAYMDGFQPVEAEKLVVESTYGIPAYRFPPQHEVDSRIRDWIKDNQDKPLILYAYSLGKAQKIQHLVQEISDREIIAHGAVKKMNDAVESLTEHDFRAKTYKHNKEVLEDNGLLIAPSRTSRSDFSEKIVKKYGALKAGFSGWAATESFQYRGGYDKTFVYSDHCDFDELVELVKKVDPEKVYTHHGFDEEFAAFLSRELGYNARALKNNQMSLTDF